MTAIIGTGRGNAFKALASEGLKENNSPHVSVKLWPRRSEQTKQRLADAIVEDVVNIIGFDEESVSVSIEDVSSGDWKKEAYDPEIEDLEKNDRLEILYFPLGYITPEEFYHRMFMSIQRLKYGKRNKGIESRNVTVLFNSLDQLRSRFSLCAKQQIFVPGIIETFLAKNISYIFIAVEEPGQPDEQFGLRSTADALISFKHEPMLRNDYLGHLHDHFNLAEEIIDYAEEFIPATPKPVTIRVVRFAGGHAAGDAGILELITTDSAKEKLYRDLGLQFVPFSSKSKRSITEISVD